MGLGAPRPRRPSRPLPRWPLPRSLVTECRVQGCISGAPFRLLSGFWVKVLGKSQPQRCLRIECGLYGLRSYGCISEAAFRPPPRWPFPRSLSPPAPMVASNRLFQLSCFVPRAASFQRAPVQTKDLTKGDLVPL